MKENDNNPSAKINVYTIVTDIIVQMILSWCFLALVDCKVDITYTFGDVVWLTFFSIVCSALFFRGKW